MDHDDSLMVPYWLRAVRIGLGATVIVLATLVVVPFLPHDFRIDTPAYPLVLVGGTVGGILVALLPWRRLFESGRWGVRLLYVWSMADIALVSVGLAATGGARSSLFFVYALTTVFFGAAYPPRSQVGLLGFTVAAYLVAVAADGWRISPAELLLRFSVLGTLTILTSFMFREILREVRAHGEARASSERWAQLLSTVTQASRDMTLSQDGIMDAAIAGVAAMGFDGAAICELDEEGGTFGVSRSTGVPDEFAAGRYPASRGLVGRVMERGETVALTEYGRIPDAIPVMREAGFRSVVASPIWVDGWLAYVLVGGYTDNHELPPQEVAAFELLASHAGLSLENARRFEDEHRTVERLGELDKLKSDFLATVSHELRTPVTVIQGVGSTLERVWDTIDPETLRKMLEGMNQNARSLETIITTLLDFSRLEAGEARPVVQPVELGGLVLSAVDRIQAQFPGRQVWVEAPPGLVAEADPALLDRVLGHLLSNALTHTPEGTPVTVKVLDEAVDLLVLVWDEGPGIPADELPHVTERFYRGGDINTRPRGLGLGLALVSEMLNLLGTVLEIDSEPGRGSVFGFRLPRSKEAPPGPPSAGATATAREAPVGTDGPRVPAR
jgi:signal transduction histidine kinase